MLEHFQHTLQSNAASAAQVYCAQLPIDELGAAFRRDINVPVYCSSADRLTTNVWLGLGACTPLHWDAHENLLVQVCGRKHVRLYSPADSRRLHPFQTEAEGPRNASRIVNIAEAEASPSAWPGFADAQYQQCWLEPGDMLYIPQRWWHAMQSEHPTTLKQRRNEARSATYNISVNFWFAQQLQVCDLSNTLSL